LLQFSVEPLFYYLNVPIHICWTQSKTL